MKHRWTAWTLGLLSALALVAGLAWAPQLSVQAAPDPLAVAKPKTSTPTSPGITLRVYGAGGPKAPMEEALALFARRKGIAYQLTAGPTSNWLEQAKQDGDLVYFGAEYVMDAFQEGRTYAGDARLVTEGLILEATRASTYVRGSGILVRPGNPLGISSLADLAQPGINILVVHGAGQIGLWEDMAAQAEIVPEIRANITLIAADGAQAIEFWNTHPEINAWITWESWHNRLPDTTELVTVDEAVKIYRGTPIAVLARSQQPQLAQEFIEFLHTAEVRQIFIRWGWAR